MRTLFVVFLFGHAAVHGVMWTLPFTDATSEMPFDPAHSWLLGDRPVIAVVAAGAAALGFVVSGVVVAADAAWWPPVMLASSALSLALMVVFLSPWWSVGLVLSAGLAAYAWQAT